MFLNSNNKSNFKANKDMNKSIYIYLYILRKCRYLLPTWIFVIILEKQYEKKKQHEQERRVFSRECSANTQKKNNMAGIAFTTTVPPRFKVRNP